MGKDGIETRNGQEMGNKTRNGRKWETRQDQIHHFLTKKQEKQRKTKKYRGKSTRKKTENYKKYRNKISKRFWKMLKK